LDLRIDATMRASAERVAAVFNFMVQ